MFYSARRAFPLARALSSCTSTDVSLSVGPDKIATLKIDRPEVKNAFSDVVISELDAALQDIEAKAGRGEVRGMVLRSGGNVFCAGADLEWMQRAAGYSREENRGDALRLSGMLNRLQNLSVPTAAIVQGHAFGGGVGLIACCDFAVGTGKAKFCLSEVKLGLTPATISPFVVSRIGPSQARRLFCGEVFSADTARHIGLLHEVVEDPSQLDSSVHGFISAVLAASPDAVRNAKLLIKMVSGKEVTPELMASTADALCDQRASEAGREGLDAFLSKRPANWVASPAEE